MPDQGNVFKITFMTDLNPYAKGLESMLVMTQNAKQQLGQILSKGVAPDFGPIEAELKRIQAEMQSVVVDASATEKNLAGVSGENNAAATASRKAISGYDGQATSMRGLRRETSHIMGAMGFLALAISQTGDAQEKQSGPTKRLIQDMREGAMSAFGFSYALMMIPGVSQEAALGIGAMVGTGTALVKFFDDSEERARQAAAALEQFNQSVKGMSPEDMKKYQDVLGKQIETRGKSIAAFEELKVDWNKANPTMGLFSAMGLKGVNPYEDIVRNLSEAQKGDKAYYDSLGKQIESQVLNTTQLGEMIKDMAASTKAMKWDQMREEARLEYERLVKQIAAMEEKDEKDRANKLRALELAEELHQKKLKSIRLDELKERNQQTIAIYKIETDTAKLVIDTNEKVELSTARSEAERVAIREKYALKLLEIEEREAVNALQIESDALKKAGGAENFERARNLDAQIIGLKSEFGQKRAAAATSAGVDITALGETGSVQAQQTKIKDLQENIAKETVESKRHAMEGQIKIEEETLFKMTHTQDEYYDHIRELENRRLEHFANTHRAEMTMVDVFVQGFETGFERILMIQREAANTWDAIWISMENSAFKALEDILTEEIKIAYEKSRTESGANAAASSPGEGTTIGTAVSMIGSVLSFLGGGKTSPMRSEGIMPMAAVMPAMRQYTIPMQHAASVATAVSAGRDTAVLSAGVEKLNTVLKNLPKQIELRTKPDGSLYAAVKIAEQRYNRNKL